MNDVPVWVGMGGMATVMLLLGVLIACLSGWRVALATLGLTLGGLAAVIGIMMFWFWIGGVFS